MTLFRRSLAALPLRPASSLLPPLRLPARTGLRFESGGHFGEGTKVKRPDPEPMYLPSSVELWANRSVKPSPRGPEIDEQNDILQHPLYTPLQRPDISIGPLIKPLHFPEFDQSKDYWTKTGIPSPETVNDVRYINQNDAFIGDYPQLQPQYVALRDPFIYWDQQGRRNFGQILHDLDDFMDEWSPGPVMHWYAPVMSLLQVGAFVGSVATLIYFWDTEKHLLFAEKDYPYDGLRVELGCDPKDPSDNWGAAHTYKI